MDKLKMHSPNLTQENIERILELFPNCRVEAKGEDGQIKLSVDFDQLRQELSDSIVEGPQERYHLNWPGKREALITANAPIAKTLRPCREESVDFDTTKNLFIEGDNLEVLKLLQKSYANKVKMIYIDPPYNTDGDFYKHTKMSAVLLPLFYNLAMHIYIYCSQLLEINLLIHIFLSIYLQGGRVPKCAV